LIELVREDADALNCTAELEDLRRIIKRGTSAHRQIETFEAEQKAHPSENDAIALKAVVDQLINETRDFSGIKSA
jgi:carboxylate-amine ligase